MKLEEIFVKRIEEITSQDVSSKKTKLVYLHFITCALIRIADKLAGNKS